MRSTRPLAWGERAKICCMPSSTMARLKWVASTGGWMWRGFPENLKTPWRSPYRAMGIPQRWISPSISSKQPRVSSSGRNTRVGHGAGGIVHHQQQGELRDLRSPSHR